MILREVMLTGIILHGIGKLMLETLRNALAILSNGSLCMDCNCPNIRELPDCLHHASDPCTIYLSMLCKYISRNWLDVIPQYVAYIVVRLI